MLALGVLADDGNRLLAVTPRVFAPLDYRAQKTLDQTRLARQEPARNRQTDIGEANFFFRVAEHVALGLLELREIASAERHGVDRARLQRRQSRAAKTDRNIGDGVGIDAMLAQQQTD